MEAYDLLNHRDFVFQTTDARKVRKLLNTPGATVYEGFDPSADSLHLGHLLSLMAMHHLQKAGHRVIFILGGATGLIGDPTGKKTSRKLLSAQDIAANGEKMKKQVEEMGLLRFSGENAALMIDNSRWMGNFSFLNDFMIKVAKVFSVNEMVKMRTFADRLKDEGSLTLMEFCYPVLQAWDFLELFEQFGCRLQIGGQDQWANILQGASLIKKIHGAEVHALTFPLLTTASGEKMGKTEKGPIWLDPKKTSPFDFYQYLIQTPDQLVPQMLRMFTFLPLEEIEKAILNPREAQRLLAFETTKVVHGEEEAVKARRDTEKLFGKSEGGTEAVPTFKMSAAEMPLDEILVQAKSLPSKSEVKRRCQGGAVQIDGQAVTDSRQTVNKGCVIRFGKGSFLKVET
ncbi:MAG: Tyrosine-tRNA ligase [Candidatus Magasanikbacteria bacterium GW2011_GWC2_40_17]|uniref:Tyrosine--tRNA ligase n=1 Tax=Candidatus Magasanikbacteria bacterium GW2011_GWA2_42_32 TaxID=1619039 RepID=A0A0G1A8H5_9BACT|nr:MAG: Tyrosine-tRNA ligase [Candidatus Magasanikbacteria bacterium GW2011_GWC2_40_17]KKS57224.1 MAG: Tyrosine-tRNA ligase [Candidatus Magasanikbacteria bacterium GW2011_GWA2_42_32]OGH86181.1 MAG: tyrosine--tRNA ligase [Candidatus Magasanikbacteria bacterium RIFOXYB2_FULL_38_10]